MSLFFFLSMCSAIAYFLAFCCIYLVMNLCMQPSAAFIPSQVLLKGRSKDTRKDATGTTFSSNSDIPKAISKKVSMEIDLTSIARVDGSVETVKSSCSSDDNVSAAHTSSPRRKTRQSKQICNANKSGNKANVYWRAVPMNDLRLHPLFQSLPDASEVQVLSVKDLGLFQQDSWQWDALHQGRLTTSRLASILGFYEKNTSSYLGIPESLRGHDRVLGAWQHLRQKPPLNWSHLNDSDVTFFGGGSHVKKQSQRTWIQSLLSDSKQRFEYDYCPQTRTQHHHYRYATSSSSARMAWGSAQEATAILAVLNYLSKYKAGSNVCESGMCCFEALEEIVVPCASVQELSFYQRLNHQIYIEKSLPLLGASPDGLIKHGDGTCEVLEVKCFSPFVNNPDRSSGHRLSISYYRPSNEQEGIPVWHVPQLQMEMLCAGSECTGAILVVLYVDGAKLYRIARDDSYQEEMMRWVNIYFTQYHKRGGKRQTPPPINFLQPQGNEEYVRFLQWTKRIATSAKLIATLGEDEIQRSPLNTQFFVD